MSELTEAEEPIFITRYEPGDEHEILRVFKKVFQVDRSMDAWRWQYAQNPAGLHCHLAKTRDNRVVSQFVGVPRRMQVRDEVLCFSEIVDSFTDPDHRQGLKKPGWFARTCYAFVDHYGRPDREVIMYGLPNPMAYRVGSRLLGYEHFYRVELLTRELPKSAEPVFLDDGAYGEDITSFGSEFDDLFATLRARHPVLTVRDSTYLNWRYCERPDAIYDRVAFCNKDSSLRGFAVFRHRWLDQPVSALAELVLDPEDPATPSIVSYLEARAAAQGAERIQIMMSPHTEESNGLKLMGYEPQRSQFRLVARTYDRTNVPLDWLCDNWYLTLGDFDII